MKGFVKSQLYKSLILGVVLILPAVSVHASSRHKSTTPQLQQVWKLDGIDTPESVLEVHKGHESYFLVSAIEGDFFTKDGKGSIVKISATGEILERDWVSGLNAPKGMAMSKGKLYVADIDEIVVIDIASVSIAERILVPNAILLNDVAADSRGHVYVSDTFGGQVFRLANGVVEEYLTGVNAANGLLVDHNVLLVGAASELLVVDKAKQRTVLVNDFPLDIDGITKWGCQGYIVSAWDGLIYAINTSGEKTLLLDSVGQNIQTADLTYSKRYNLLVVPNFFSHSVTAYKVVGR